MRTALVALIAFMPTKPNGAIGSLEYTKKERRALAIKSRQQAPQFGSPERQAVIQQVGALSLGTKTSFTQAWCKRAASALSGLPMPHVSFMLSEAIAATEPGASCPVARCADPRDHAEDCAPSADHPAG